MTTNRELENHINTHFLIENSGPVQLNEVHGYVNNIDEIVKYFVSLVVPQIKQVFKEDCLISKPYNGEINIKDCFFNSYKLNVSIEKNTKKQYSGGANSNSVFKNNDGTWSCIPIISLNIKGNTITEVVETFAFAIGHELTHCYNLLQYALQNNDDPFYSVKRNRYFDIAQSRNFDTNNVKASATILYNLNRLERNAYIAQLKQELLFKKDKIKDNKTAFQILKQTESYKKFLYLEKQVSTILTITNKDVQEELIYALNKIMNKNFTTFKQLKKYYLNRWLKWKKAYLSVASKIVYDVYAEDNKWLDWGMLDNNPEIKPE